MRETRPYWNRGLTTQVRRYPARDPRDRHPANGCHRLATLRRQRIDQARRAARRHGQAHRKHRPPVLRRPNTRGFPAIGADGVEVQRETDQRVVLARCRPTPRTSLSRSGGRGQLATGGAVELSHRQGALGSATRLAATEAGNSVAVNRSCRILDSTRGTAGAAATDTQVGTVSGRRGLGPIRRASGRSARPGGAAGCRGGSPARASSASLPPAPSVARAQQRLDHRR